MSLLNLLFNLTLFEMIAYCLLQAYYIIQSFTLKTVTIIIFKFYVYNKMLKGMTKF